MMIRPARLAPPFLLSLLAAGCVAAPEPAAPPPAVIAMPPSPPPAEAPRDRRPDPGSWRYARTAGGSAATFAAGRAVLACRLAGRTVSLSPAMAGVPVTVRTTSATRRLSPAADGTIALVATDPLLDAMAFSRGRFTIEADGATPLVLPVQAEIGRVIEDCRG